MSDGWVSFLQWQLTHCPTHWHSVRMIVGQSNHCGAVHTNVDEYMNNGQNSKMVAIEWTFIETEQRPLQYLYCEPVNHRTVNLRYFTLLQFDLLDNFILSSLIFRKMSHASLSDGQREELSIFLRRLCILIEAIK